MRWIYISPHLDDAALCAGGLLYEQSRAGLDVEIWTLTCGSPPDGDLSPVAQAVHRQWGIDSVRAAIAARKAEDKAAAKILGAKTVHFDFLDCIYRRDSAGNWIYANIFTQPHEADASLPSQMAATLSARLLPADRIVCPFGLGSHVDHILARRAAELLRRPLYFVADIPYLFKYPDSLESCIVGMKAQRQPISEAGFGAWLEASAAYQSQLSSLFASPQEMEAQFHRYWSEVEGVRLWQAE